MTRVILIRPGSTDYDEQNRIQGTLDIPLNTRGTQEAAQTAEALQGLSLNRIFSSAGESAGETARLIGKKLGIRFRKLDKLHNLNQGLWQGLQLEEVRRKHPKVYRQWCEEPTTVCPPGGETVIDAFHRVTRVLKPLLKRHKDEVIGLVVPEPLARVVRCFLLGLELTKLPEVAEIDGRWQIVDLKDPQPAPANAAHGQVSP